MKVSSSSSSSKNKQQKQKGTNIQFFWEKKNSKNRSRFNLLLLDYGEYLLEDLSAYYFPIPTSDLSKSFEVKDSLKVQGRLKLCSRSLIFEPADVRFPIMKFPYKYITCSLEEFRLKDLEIEALSQDLSPDGFFTYTCSCYINMKENNKIGPYKTVDLHSNGGSHRCVFTLVHAELSQFLVKVEQLRHIHSLYIKQGSSVANQLLKPFMETAQLWTLNFNTSQLVSFHEQMLFDAPVALRRIRPLMTHPGSLMMTESRVYFQPSQLNNIGGELIIHFEIRRISRVFKRRYLLRQTGLEVLLNDGSSYLFACDTKHIRDYLYDTLVSQPALRKLQQSDLLESSNNNKSARNLSGVQFTSNEITQMTTLWQQRHISNFEYLMFLNNEADRSINDIAQYPVFPHIIADFTSRKLNLESPSTFRDLSKPVGALNPERLEYFRERFLSMPAADSSSGLPPPFLYGTHYSTPGYVLHYLVRVAPEYMLCLQNGKFDAPDRMFHSIEGMWQSCLTNPADLKELIPEFFTGSGEFLVNFDDLDLGHRQTGERLNDVDLPRWADSPRDFIRKNAKALESDYVSAHLHEWIDLIFGYKQKGEEAVKANNLYYHVTYEGAVDLDKIDDSRERDAMVLQIQEFGQTPKQLFVHPHPCRNDPIDGASMNVTSSVEQNTIASSDGVKEYDKKAVGADFTGKSSSEAVAASTALTEHDSLDTRDNFNTRKIDDFDEGEVKIVHLDDDFKRQVAVELQTNPNFTSNRDDSGQVRQISADMIDKSSITPARMIVHAPTKESRENVESVGRGSGGVGNLLDSVFSWSRTTAASLLSVPSQGSSPQHHQNASNVNNPQTRNSANLKSSSTMTQNSVRHNRSSSAWSPLRMRLGSSSAEQLKQKQQQTADADLIARFRRPSENPPP